jgi:hypothetical protein
MNGDETEDLILVALESEQLRRTQTMALGKKIRRAVRGHKNGEVLTVLCCQLAFMVNNVPIERRPTLMSAIMRMIDPASLTDKPS